MPTIDASVTFVSRMNFMKKFYISATDCEDKGCFRQCTVHFSFVAREKSIGLGLIGKQYN